jgi:hypothetical protein
MVGFEARQSFQASTPRSRISSSVSKLGHIFRRRFDCADLR